MGTITRESGFVADLDAKDLHRLREITRRAYRQRFPNSPPLADSVCDHYIEQLGPQSAVRALRATVKAMN